MYQDLSLLFSLLSLFPLLPLANVLSSLASPSNPFCVLDSSSGLSPLLSSSPHHYRTSSTSLLSPSSTIFCLSSPLFFSLLFSSSPLWSSPHFSCPNFYGLSRSLLLPSYSVVLSSFTFGAFSRRFYPKRLFVRTTTVQTQIHTPTAESTMQGYSLLVGSS